MRKEIFPNDKEILSDEEFQASYPTNDEENLNAKDGRELKNPANDKNEVKSAVRKTGQCASYRRGTNGNLHFFYSREERLKKAPRIVKDVYNGNFKLNKGFRAIFANKVNRFMFITIVIGFAFIFARPFWNSHIFSDSLENGTLEAFAFEQSVFVTLKIPFQIKSEEAIIFCALDKNGRTIEKKEIDSLEKKDVFRLKFQDSGIEKILVFLQKNGREEKMECDVSR